ncbi:hypothetical protein NC652_004563 [Populus alba x Populus x berolinensis]|nr:hypothetical protein NC652_004563 [Populus alba x Populus x berolinensis]
MQHNRKLPPKKLLVQERGWFYVVFIIFVNVIRDHFLIYLLLNNNKDLKSSRSMQGCLIKCSSILQ